MNVIKTQTRPLGFALLGLLVGLSAFAQVPRQSGWLARETAQEDRVRARYPESSRALGQGEADPLRAERIPTRASLAGPEGAEPTLSVWNSAIAYEAGRPVDLFASLTDRGTAAKALAITGDVVDEAGAILARFDYRDDGLAPDVAAGDGVWSARLAAPQKFAAGRGGSFLVRVLATTAKGEPRQAAGGFLYGRPGARTTGNVRDAVVDGNLRVEVELDVLAAGRYHVAATIYDRSGLAVGIAQAAARLEPGQRWLVLDYYGLMFHEKKAQGPFRVGTLALTTAGAMPNVLSDLAFDVHTTRSYRAEQFTNAAFADPARLEHARRLEADALRSAIEGLEAEN